jgi:hypothetical protein
MAVRELVGTWEEILAHAPELAGRKLRVTLLPDVADETPPSSRVSAVLAEMRRHWRHMSPKPDDRDLLREARAGAMWGYDPEE